jgi:hypothetical protein
MFEDVAANLSPDTHHLAAVVERGEVIATYADGARLT